MKKANEGHEGQTKPEGDQNQNLKNFLHFWVPWESFMV